MSKNIELQEEFESLIYELQRLKSINEITSSNSENAKNTIDEVKSFVQSVQTFKTSIEKDYETKKKDLDEIESSLNQTLKTLNDNVAKQSKKFAGLASNFDISSVKTLGTVKQELKAQIDVNTAEMNSFKKKLSSDFAHFTKVSNEEIENTSIKTLQSLINNKNEIISQFQQLNKEIEYRTSKTSDTLVKNHNIVLEHFQKQNSQIITNANRLKKLTVFIVLVVSVAAICCGFLLYKLM